MTTAHALEIPGTAPGTYLSACSTCHKTDDADDHPKVHYGPDKYHFDCLPARVVEDILANPNLTDADKTRLQATIDAATAEGKTNLHGHDLRVRAIHLRFEHPNDGEPQELSSDHRAFLAHVGAPLPGITNITKGGKSNG